MHTLLRLMACEKPSPRCLEKILATGDRDLISTYIAEVLNPTHLPFWPADRILAVEIEKLDQSQAENTAPGATAATVYRITVHTERRTGETTTRLTYRSICILYPGGTICTPQPEQYEAEQRRARQVS